MYGKWHTNVKANMIAHLPLDLDLTHVLKDEGIVAAQYLKAFPLFQGAVR